MRKLWISLVLVLAGCRVGPDPVCVSYCERDNDACMLHSRDATQVQYCDSRLTQCVQSCR
ncbi:MAG: hypothetical protein IT378_15380 [Sandaracinaceae bacterium]|nr:hypothetical protein [Sandaracinaceae bacterium]